ncbi:MAG: DNA repair protein RecN, partial [Deltaproteobacteria bacterium]
MLRELKIKNLALIEELHLLVDAGLIVLTGETGAGKSIILQAIFLLSGGRADSSWVRTGTEESLIEALFDYPENSQLPEMLAGFGLPVDEALVIRRLISSRGKSRFYINGAMATAKVTSELVEHLLCVASQHDHQQLLHPAQHLAFLDLAGDLFDQRAAMENLYDALRARQEELKSLKMSEREALQRRDLLSFQVKEIEEAALTVGEDEELEVEKNRLRSSEQLQELGAGCYQALEESAGVVLQQVRRDMERMATLDDTIAPLAEKVAGLSYEMEDSTAALRSYLEELPHDPQRLEEVGERLHLISQLRKKYGASIADILSFGEQAARELDNLNNREHDLDALQLEVGRLEKQAIGEAEALSHQRRKIATELEEKLQSELASLCLEEARFKVAFKQSGPASIGNLQRSGIDELEFLFSASRGEPVKSLAKIASGGELSRLMLAFRCMLAKRDRIDTVIFDEVDAGVSGKAAEKVAEKIRELAGHHQVLCITHLPQIAAAAKDHFRVAKRIVGDRTVTEISRLPEEKRVAELARMLDGA